MTKKAKSTASEKVFSSDSSVRNIEIEQQIEYGFTLDLIREKVTGWDAIKKAAAFYHNEDIDTSGERVNPHIHLYLAFNNPTKCSVILNRFNVNSENLVLEFQHLEKIKSWVSAIGYGLHDENFSGLKTRYTEDHCIFHWPENYDWKAEFFVAHKKNISVFNKEKSLFIADQIEQGIIKRYNIEEHLTCYDEFLYSAVIKKAFERRIRIQKKACKKKMEVIFISGPSGIGKDTLADKIATDRFGKNSYYRCNNSDNKFDDYLDQPCIIWSDARDAEYRPQQLFALLDNFWSSNIKARYSDVCLNCNLFIITSYKSLDQWYSKSFEENAEATKQLFRRCKTWIRMKSDICNIYLYNENENKYFLSAYFNNEFRDPSLTLSNDNQRRQYLETMLPSLEMCFQEGLPQEKEAVSNDEFKQIELEDLCPWLAE